MGMRGFTAFAAWLHRVQGDTSAGSASVQAAGMRHPCGLDIILALPTHRSASTAVLSTSSSRIE